MGEALSALFKVLGIALAGLILAGWHSISVLETASRQLRRFHDWTQLRIYARRVGLLAYKDAHSRAIRVGSNTESTANGPSLGTLEGATKGLHAESC